MQNQVIRYIITVMMGIFHGMILHRKSMNTGKKAGLIRKNTVISPITSDQYQTAAVRPAMSVFNRDKVVRVLGFCIKDWKTNLHEYLERIANENL